MFPHTSYAADAQSQSAALAATILSSGDVSAAVSAVNAFLRDHSPADQSRWFFSLAFPTLISRLFGFHSSSDSSSRPSSEPNTGWIEVPDSEVSAAVFELLSPNGALTSAISAVDRVGLVKYVFPAERLPEWARFAVQNDAVSRVLPDLCPLFRGKLNFGTVTQVQLNVFEYYMFWFAYYPVCRGNSEKVDSVRAMSKGLRLESLKNSISMWTNKGKKGEKSACRTNLYDRLLYAYLRAFVPLTDWTAHSPYRSSLLHYPFGCDTSVVEKSEFVVNTFIHFWLVDNDFSPLPISACKSYGLNFPFRSSLGELPPLPGLGEVVSVFVKYLNLSLISNMDGSYQIEYTCTPKRPALNSADARLRDSISGVQSLSSWTSGIQRPLYRFILRTLICCPVETSVKNVSQVFSLWVSYIEPWKISLEDFGDLDVNVGELTGTANQSKKREYSSSWQGFVLANYLFYSSLVMHFFGFSHKFLHTDPEVIVQMVSKVVDVLISSKELLDLIKNVDTVYHSVPVRSSKSAVNSFYRFVPLIREQLQDWEDGLSESDADGSFLHENWNKDLQLFAAGEDGGQQLLQLFILRAESELQAASGGSIGNSLRLLDSVKSKMASLFGGNIVTPVFTPTEGRQSEKSSNEMFRPRASGNSTVNGRKYKGDWMKRPVTNDEIAWLAKLLVCLSVWLNEILGLNQGQTGYTSSPWSYVEISGVSSNNVNGISDTGKLVMRAIGSWLIALGREVLRFMKEHGIRVNLRVLASKKVVTVLLMFVAFSALKRAFFRSV